MYDVKVLPQAVRDIETSVLWYTQQQSGLGQRFLSDVELRVQMLRKYPLISSIRYENVRTAVLHKFPYMIHYTVDEKLKILLITGVFHTRQNPMGWAR